ncbi:helix-turn-helix domain-containing protein [Bradyrhizobium sp. SZCCHNRI1029]|uniref:helix-turn-helix domain-containing protein n=1 Tax=Bradyrhizobium sp. SZCCHNRI1029 TaxID=3057278 RepID=UPI002915F034|nr:helix-turn-helix domain-containing protein [Bradyrhizobium sp. SZCCHNRI1029]
MPNVQGFASLTAPTTSLDPLLGWTIHEAISLRQQLRQLGDALVIEAQVAQGCAGMRRASDAGLVVVMTVIEGRERGEDSTGTVLFEAGDVIVWNTRETLAFATLSPLRKMMIACPEAVIRNFHPDLIGRGPLHLPGRHGFGAAVSGYFEGFAGTLAEMDDREAHAAVDTGLEIVARAVRLVRRDAAPRRSSARFARIMSYIDAQLHDPDLDSAEIAAHFGLSVRSVQLLFAEHGTTPSECIRQRRLNRCRRDLQAARRTESITDIALRWGFNDPSHFSRLFRRRYGVPPRTLVRKRPEG